MSLQDAEGYPYYGPNGMASPEVPANSWGLNSNEKIPAGERCGTGNPNKPNGVGG